LLGKHSYHLKYTTALSTYSWNRSNFCFQLWNFFPEVYVIKRNGE
jgi:hypothetical protein